MLSLFANGVTREYPNIRFIFCHGGGVMPALPGRIDGSSGWRTVGPEGLASPFPHGICIEFAKVLLDCAQAYAAEFISLLRTIVPESQLLFGSEFSYVPIGHSVAEYAALDLDRNLKSAIGGGNASSLFPLPSSLFPLPSSRGSRHPAKAPPDDANGRWRMSDRA